MTKYSAGPEYLCFCHSQLGTGQGDGGWRCYWWLRLDGQETKYDEDFVAVVETWPWLTLAPLTQPWQTSGRGYVWPLLARAKSGHLHQKACCWWWPWPEWRLPTKQTDWCTTGSHDQTLGWGLYAFEFVKKFPTEQRSRLATLETLNGTIVAKGKYN